MKAPPQNERIIDHFGYRPDIDGLRAIAVIAVVLFHAGLGFPGGYVGVDVFFVISGFLITSLIIKDLEQEKFSLVNFWERRVRRIWPPLIVVTASTLVAGWFLMLPTDYAELGRSSIWQTLLSSNLYFWRDSGYFASASEQKPLLHTWSLAVEEQFYLLLPLALVAIAWTGKLSRSVLLGLFIAIVAVGLAISSYGVVHHPSATFFLLPTRSWELALGSFLAVWPPHKLPAALSGSSLVTHEVLNVIGLLGILAPCFLYDSTTLFPGLAAVPPCLGTAILIWANRPIDSVKTGRVASILASRFLVYIGLISYSLYLWHWPVFAFTHYWNFGGIAFYVRVSCVAFSVLLAIGSWYFIEGPTRRKTVLSTRGPLFGCALVSSALMLAASYSIDSSQGKPDRLPVKAQEVLEKAYERTLNRKRMQELGVTKQPTSVDDIESGTLLRLGVESDKPDFLLWGDSHAQVAMTAFAEVAEQHGLTGRAAILYSTAPFINFDAGIKTGERDAPLYADRLIEMIRQRRIKNVYLSAYWSLYIGAVGEGNFEDKFRATITRIASSGAKVWVLLDVPTHQIDVPKSMVGTHLLPFLQWRIEGCTKEEHVRKNSVMYRLAKQNLPATFIDPSPALINSSTNRYEVMRASTPLYYDDNHLTSEGSRTVLFPLISETIKKEVRSGSNHDSNDS